MAEIKRVTIPACVQHEGVYSIDVNIEWLCPVCGGPRGEVYETVSYDGSRRLHCHGWVNPCGHIDKYSAVRREALENGLNLPEQQTRKNVHVVVDYGDDTFNDNWRDVDLRDNADLYHALFWYEE